MRQAKISAGAVVVRPAQRGWEYLVLRVFRNWDFPKGRVEAGEAPVDAAKREVAEETALTQLDFRWGEDYAQTEPYSDGKVARYYLAALVGGEASLPVNPELGHPEHHEFRWCSYDEAMRLLPLRLQPVLQWARDKLGTPRVS